MPDQPTPGAIARLGQSAKRWAASFIAPAQQITQGDMIDFGIGTTTIASLLSAGRRQARARQVIYQKWMEMEGDPIVSTALSLQVTSALGGHETSGQMVFVETAAKAKGNKQLERIAKEVAEDLAPLFNRIAFKAAYTGAAYGDSYARMLFDKTRPSRGVIDLYVDEMVHPALIQPFEKGSRTVGFAISIGERNFERLNVSQMARVKMPRIQWIPQHGVVEKAIRTSLQQDDFDDLPIVPAMAGGSLLYGAEDAYDKLTASLIGLVGQRWIDSIDEDMLGVNLANMSQQQQKTFLQSVTNMLKASKDRTDKAVKAGMPVLERIRHLLPVWNEKQLFSLTGGPGKSSRSSSISIEDVMLHARMLAGALGTDLSMLGFSDQLTGGLGDGNGFRVSAQAAERARVIRWALSDFFNDIANIHTMRRYGVVFSADERPWELNYYGSISALEAERQSTRADAMQSGSVLTQVMQQLKDMGASKEMATEFLTKQMLIDEDQAAIYASIVDAPTPPEEGGGAP